MHHPFGMPSPIILALLLGSSIPVVAPKLATLERSAPVQVDCIGKKRVVTPPARAKKAEPRRRCHVLAPILM